MNPIPASEHNTFQRSPDSGKNSGKKRYCMISRDLICDNSLSLDCRALICYLICMTEGWVINFDYIRENFKPVCGRQRLKKILEEAIRAGYINREEWKEERRRPNGAFQGTFKRVRYFVLSEKKAQTFRSEL